MTEQEYQARARPRLAAIDRLSESCAWHKYDCQCTAAELRARDQWRQLMDEQSADEVEMGY